MAAAGRCRCPGNDQYQTPRTPIRTKISDTKRPIPEKRAIETNSLVSDFVDDEVVGIDGEMRTAFGISALQSISGQKSRPFGNVLAAATKVQRAERVSSIASIERGDRPAQPTKEISSESALTDSVFFARIFSVWS
jgi:hypothetical protein